MELSRRARALMPSPTMALDARVKALLAQGADIVNFGVGEPDFDTPTAIREAAIRAIEAGYSRYTPVAGLPALREAVAAKLAAENGLSYGPGEIVVTVGAKHALYNAMMVLLDPGDEVLLPSPYWVTYPEQVRLTGAQVVAIPTRAEEGFRLTPAALEAAITPRSRLLILNSPANPTGAVYGREELSALAEVALRHDLWVVSDEIYEYLVYDGVRHESIAAVVPEMRERTVVINGVSKGFAMTGWRIGYAAAPPAVARAMADLQSQVTSNATAVAQMAALAALQGDRQAVRQMVAAFAERRQRMVEGLRSLPGFHLPVAPNGAFYAFPDISAWMGREIQGRPIQSGDDLAALLLESAGVAVVPGSGFGYPEAVRLSYATSSERIREGLGRIARVLGS